MKTNINFYSEKDGEIKRFLEHYYSKNLSDFNYNLHYQMFFDTPIDMIDIIGCFIDNKDHFDINLWVSLDEGVLILVNEDNVNSLIKYIYERFPY